MFMSENPGRKGGIGRVAQKWRLITDCSLESREELIRRGDIVVMGGREVAVHLPMGYKKLSLRVPFSTTGVPRESIYKMALVVDALNPESSFEQLAGFMCDIISNSITRDFYSADKSEVEDLVSHAIDNYVDPEEIADTRYYYWLTHNLSWREKTDIVNRHRGESLVAENIKVVDKAVDELIEEEGKFITYDVIAKRSGLSRETIKRRVNEEMHEKIGAYNAESFQSSTYHGYLKNKSIAAIVGAIRKIHERMEKVTRVKVLKETDLHYTTIKKWWSEDEIQEELNRYNQVIQESL